MMSGNQQGEIAKGLEGVVAAETKIGFVDGINGRLVYRGYNIEDLVEKSNFEEVAYLLIYGKLPTQTEFKQFRDNLNLNAGISEDLFSIISDTTHKSHPMSALRTAISYQGAFDPLSSNSDLKSQEKMGLSIMGSFPSIVAAINRSIKGEGRVVSKSTDYVEKFLEESFGRKPSDFEKEVMRVALIIHADHGMNASTFASMVTISTLSDMYSAVTSAVSSLKGPLHGGANEKSLEMLEKIGSPKNAEKVISEMLEKKEKIMGFGHRVYKVYDPRAKILKVYAKQLAEKTGHKELFETAEEVEKVMVSKLGSKGIFPYINRYATSSKFDFSTRSSILYPL